MDVRWVWKRATERGMGVEEASLSDEAVFSSCPAQHITCRQQEYLGGQGGAGVGIQVGLLCPGRLKTLLLVSTQVG